MSLPNIGNRLAVAWTDCGKPWKISSQDIHCRRQCLILVHPEYMSRMWPLHHPALFIKLVLWQCHWFLWLYSVNDRWMNLEHWWNDADKNTYFCSPEISYVLAWNLSWVFAARGWLLFTWAMAWPQPAWCLSMMTWNQNWKGINQPLRNVWVLCLWLML
jgi:hypothetical protein